ncbi:MAG: tRNA lysidine(34) synthetase TilS [Alloprevotella sp.]
MAFPQSLPPVVSPSQRLIVAVSGGADSVAMLLFLKEMNANIAAVAHCNFQLRGEESDRDERFVENLCRRLGCELRVARFDTKSEAAARGESIEMAARRLRYAWFETLRKELKADAVAIAHHLNDDAETVLLNLIRGTGLRGLCGIPPKREGIVRPLLDASRQDVLKYLKSRGQNFVTDSSNSDTLFTRNKIRHEVLPLLRSMNGNISVGLHRMAQRLRQTVEFLETVVNRFRRERVTSLPDGERIQLSDLSLFPVPEVFLEIWLAEFGFSRTQSDSLLTGRVGMLLEANDYLCTRTHDAIEVRRRPAVVNPRVLGFTLNTLTPDSRACIEMTEVPFSSVSALRFSPAEAWLDADTVRGKLFVRSVRQNDRFRPFGMKGSKLVSDYLTDRHASRIDKLATLEVCDDNGILWLVNQTIDARCAVTDKTHSLIHLKFIPFP